jgi:hypothetical protein
MATLDIHLELELAHFENFQKHIPGYSTWCPKTVAEMLRLGIVQVSTAFEHALAKVGKFKVVSEAGHDGSDGSDAKLSSARHRAYGKAYSAWVSNTQGKTGKLRVQVYERIQNKFYYFVIPHSMHSTVKYLEIPFDLAGNPTRFSNKGGFNKWWKCEVKTFNNLAKD